jgi:sialic acid synthase SpsE
MSVYIIAEIGSSHQGDLSVAKDLIGAVKASGADCAKFQAVFANEIVHPNVGTITLPTGQIPIYQRFQQLERSFEFYAQLKQMCEDVGLDFLCTPFGLHSFDLLQQLQVRAYKVASPELNHYPLLNAIAETGKPMFVSLGVSYLADIERALATINSRSSVTLLHCITSYPAPEIEYNLNILPALQTLFHVPVGVSDHSMDPILVPSLATIKGAVAIEKHICLSRDGDGMDDPIALEPAQFTQMVQAVRRAERDVYFLSELRQHYGNDMIDATLGSGHKQLAASELTNYGRTNRSLCAVHDIEPGQILTADNIALYRVEKNLRPGLPPYHWDDIIGRVAKYAIRAGDGIIWQDIG